MVGGWCSKDKWGAPTRMSESLGRNWVSSTVRGHDTWYKEGRFRLGQTLLHEGNPSNKVVTEREGALGL